MSSSSLPIGVASHSTMSTYIEGFMPRCPRVSLLSHRKHRSQAGLVAYMVYVSLECARSLLLRWSGLSLGFWLGPSNHWWRQTPRWSMTRRVSANRAINVFNCSCSYCWPMTRSEIGLLVAVVRFGRPGCILLPLLDASVCGRVSGNPVPRT